MKKNFLLAILVSGFLFSGCSSQNILKNYNDQKIVFGDGGGFTGQVKTYHLDNIGNLSMTESLSNDQLQLKKVKKSELKKIFEKLSEIDLCHSTFNHPGNRYYFIKQEGEKDSCGVVWGDPGHQVPDKIQELYNLLMSTISTNNN